jgi:glycerophosphoryl diester phosphodiesterase
VGFSLKTQVWAHRGASAYAPENTLEAFQLAIDQGAEGIELDVQLTSDGVLVVAHDERLERVSNGSGWIYEHSLKELRGLDFSKAYPNYAITRIPTLEEVYDLVKPTDLIVNVEIKKGIVDYKGIEEKLILLEKKMKMRNRIIYSSFNHFCLMALREQDSEAKIGLLYSDGWMHVAEYAKSLNAQAIHPVHYAVRAPKLIESCKKYGIKVHPWTVDRKEDIEKLLDCQVEAIITNKPDFAKSLIINKRG